MEKLCVFCTNCSTQSQRMGSRWTGAYGATGFDCAKGHFDAYDRGQWSEDVGDIRALLLTAEKCADYEQVEL